MENRRVFLQNTDRKKICVLVGSGVGKSVTLAQIAYLCSSPASNFHDAGVFQQRDISGPLDSGHVVIAVPFTDLPTDPDDFLDNKQFLLAKKLRNPLAKANFHPDYAELNRWLRTLIQRGQLTLVVDALDQFVWSEQRTPKVCARALGDFLDRYPTIRVVVSGRPFAVKHYWSELFSDPASGSDWDFLAPCIFGDDQRAKFVGDKREAALQRLQIASSELNVPRMLLAIRNIPEKLVPGVRTAADVYWRALLSMVCPEVILSETEQQEAQQFPYSPGDPELDAHEKLFLFSLAAVQLLVEENTEGLTGTRACRDFVNRIWRRRVLHHRNGGDSEPDVIARELDFDTSRDGAKKKLQRYFRSLLKLNKSLMNFAIAGSMANEELASVKFQNRSFQDFFAAFWMANYADDLDRAWLAEHISIVYTYPDNVSDFEDHLEFWKFLCEMPQDTPGVREISPRNDRVWLRCVDLLFRRQERRPAELMYRSWPTLMRLGGFLDGETLGGDEKHVDAATSRAQLAARDSDDPCEDDKSARGIVLRFLREFPHCLRGDRGTEVKRIAQQFDDGFRPVPKNPESPLTCWFSAEEFGQLETRVRDELWNIARRFHLHEYPVTNQISRLYDPAREHRFTGLGDFRYQKMSPGETCPAIYLSWFDSWALATWLHSWLPAEDEWEFACRADPGGENGPVDFWWSQRGETFDEARQRISDHAYVNESCAGPVGVAGHFNGFDLCDMLGNVWEWTGSFANNRSASRILRGGSFDFSADVTRCSIRNGGGPAFAYRDYGVRVARA